MQIRRHRRIENRRSVIFDKTAVVTFFTAERAEIIFHRRERTNPDEILHEKSPDNRRNMQKCDPTPTQNEQTAEHREQHEKDVQN